MATAGYTFESRQALVGWLNERASPFVTAYTSAQSASAGALVLEDVFEEEALQDLHALQQTERAVAVAEYPCAVRLDDTHSRLFREYVDRLIDDYWDDR